MRSSPDPVSLAAGLAFALLGGVLMLDQADALNLTAGWAGVGLAAVIGVILVVAGLDE